MAPLQLRDVHPGNPPPWWPPAPGWWLVAGAAALVLALLAWRALRVRRRRAAIARLFDQRVAAADTPSQRLAAISELLRRAARRVHPGADTLDGEAWLALLDEGQPPPGFGGDAGALLLQGAFRPDVDAAEVEAVRVLARARYLAWMDAA